MQARLITLTPPARKQTKLVKALRARGLRVGKFGVAFDAGALAAEGVNVHRAERFLIRLARIGWIRIHKPAARTVPAPLGVAELKARVLKQAAPVVRQLVTRHYRCAAGRWAGGETSVSVSLSATPDAEGCAHRVWSKNGKWSGSDVVYKVAIATLWSKRVHAAGLAVVDALLTTHARLERESDGLRVYRAAWVRQGQGYALRSEAGWIAFHPASGTGFHSTKSANAAATGLRRKLNAQAIPQEVRDAQKRERAQRRAAARERQVRRLVERVSKYDLASIAHVEVSLQDSYRAGNCEPGTLEFRNRLFPGSRRTSAPLGEIVERLRHANLSVERLASETLGRQLIAACLVAIRRDRNASRALAASGSTTGVL